VHQSYSKPKVGRFFETRCIYRATTGVKAAGTRKLLPPIFYLHREISKYLTLFSFMWSRYTGTMVHRHNSASETFAGCALPDGPPLRLLTENVPNLTDALRPLYETNCHGMQFIMHTSNDQ